MFEVLTLRPSSTRRRAEVKIWPLRPLGAFLVVAALRFGRRTYAVLPRYSALTQPRPYLPSGPARFRAWRKFRPWRPNRAFVLVATLRFYRISVAVWPKFAFSRALLHAASARGRTVLEFAPLAQSWTRIGVAFFGLEAFSRALFWIFGIETDAFTGFWASTAR